MNRFLILLSATALSLQVSGEIPAGYYSALEGKSGDELKAAVKQATTPASVKRVDYGEKTTWPAFLKTDARTIDDNGLIWWDMYSNNIVRVSSGHDGMNIEHSVANSWFGGSKGEPDAYADLFHLNPSNEAANNQKSSLPLGIVAKTSWTNGLVKTGAPAPGNAGGASKVFEPADEYKGDFARAFFYIFTRYDRAPWKTDQNMYSVANGSAVMEKWVSDMLLEWAKNDPVDSKELNRNEEIYKLQKNRNPFIDHPDLADYLWGSLKGTAYHVGNQAEAVDRPEAPAFTRRWMTGVNTYSGRWWSKTTEPLTAPGGNLMISINGSQFDQYGSSITIPAASSHGESLVLKTYTETEKNGLTLRSSLATLTLTARQPGVADYTEAVWKEVKDMNTFLKDPEAYHIILSSSNFHIMGKDGGTSATGFMPDAGFVIEEKDEITRIPTDAALVRFQPVQDGGYLLEVLDPLNADAPLSKGFWTVMGSGNRNTLKPSTGTTATVSFDQDGRAAVTFDGGKSLLYNKTQPRFTNYSTGQTPVRLYRFDRFPKESGIDLLPADTDSEPGIAIEGNSIIIPEGWMLFDINGRNIDGRSLSAGIYIAVSRKGKSVKILIP